jgi:hypothetical protein
MKTLRIASRFACLAVKWLESEAKIEKIRSGKAPHQLEARRPSADALVARIGEKTVRSDARNKEPNVPAPDRRVFGY